jgi:hypothetical protein
MNDEMQEHVDPTTGEITSRQPLATAELSVVGAEINQQIATSHRFPRRKDKVIAEEILARATLSEEIARECFYVLSRTSRGSGESKDIVGPSIRFAEIVMASYGNIRVAARFVRIDDQHKDRAAVVIEAVAMDMQTNHAILKQFRRSIMTSPKNGVPRMFSADMINITIMAAQSIGQREVTLKLVPKALWIDGYHGAMDVVRGDAKTLNERRAKVLSGFAKGGIKAEDLFAALGIESEQEITLDLMPALAGMWNALKEGESRESVLGRVSEERNGPARSSNPLADKPVPETGAEKNVAEKQHEAPTAASAVAAKSDVAPDTPERAADTPAADPQLDRAQPEKAATDGAAQTATALTGEAYVQGALAFIANQVSAGKIKDWWRRERTAGRAVANLTPAQLDALEDAYTAKIDQLTGG